MQAIQAYCDAQIEYAEEDRNGDGMLEYAQKFISSANAQDGLFWNTSSSAEQSPSPLGPLFASTTTEAAYKGYYYRILNSQGKYAPGGAYNYIIGERMVSGFALIAWPAVYGQTGIMSFIVNHGGVIYERDLGSDSAVGALEITDFNPDAEWSSVQKVSLATDE
jgi:hypothetical protein